MAKEAKKGIGLEDFKASYVEPIMTHTRRADIERAANLHASADLSDPFARPRIVTHMKRGLALPSEVIADASAKLAARGLAKDGNGG